VSIVYIGKQIKGNTVNKTEHNRVVKAIKVWAETNDIDLTDTNFYTPKEWKDRGGEEYCLNAELMATTEGELNHILNMYNGYELHTSFFNLMDTLGYWFEMGTSWYFGIYKN